MTSVIVSSLWGEGFRAGEDLVLVGFVSAVVFFGVDEEGGEVGGHEWLLEGEEGVGCESKASLGVRFGAARRAEFALYTSESERGAANGQRRIDDSRAGPSNFSSLDLQ